MNLCFNFYIKLYVCYFFSHLLNNPHLLLKVPSGHKCVTFQNSKHVYTDISNHKYLGNSLLQ